MTKQQANAYLCAILETVAEVPTGTPSGIMYAALMDKLSLDDYQGLLDIARDCGLVKVDRSHLVTLTPKGLDMIVKIQIVKGGVRTTNRLDTNTSK